MPEAIATGAAVVALVCVILVARRGWREARQYHRARQTIRRIIEIK